MKYLIINGSPRRKNTYKIIKQAESNLDGEFEEVHLIEKQIPMCLGCMNCIVKTPIKELNEFIESHKSNLNQFILYINKSYYKQFKNVLNLHLEELYDIRITDLIEDNTMFVIIDRKLFDWGNIGIDFGKTGGDI